MRTPYSRIEKNGRRSTSWIAPLIISARLALRACVQRTTQSKTHQIQFHLTGNKTVSGGKYDKQLDNWINYFHCNTKSPNVKTNGSADSITIFYILCYFLAAKKLIFIFLVRSYTSIKFRGNRGTMTSTITTANHVDMNQ